MNSALLPHHRLCQARHGVYTKLNAGKGFGKQQSTTPPVVKRILSELDTLQREGQCKLETVRKFYEEGWSSSDLSMLDNLISEDHVQEDQVWQSAPRIGRESVKKGIGFIQKCYPDIQFTVDQLALTNGRDQVFARWTLRGTFEGQQDTAFGMALLSLNSSNQICKTEVFRQATRAEVELAKRSERGPVPQSVFLGRG